MPFRWAKSRVIMKMITNSIKKWLKEDCLGFSCSCRQLLQVDTLLVGNGGELVLMVLLIGPLPYSRVFIIQDAVIDISINMCFLSIQFLPHTTLPHIYPTSISHFSHESSNLQYQGYSTMGKMTTKMRQMLAQESCDI